MAKYQFSHAERFAVHVVHGERCYINGEPLNHLTMEVDHVVPEILESDPSALERVKEELGLPSDFAINSFSNWMPACRPCNVRKAESVFRPSGWFQGVLERAAKKAPEAEKVASELVRDRQLAKAVALLQRAGEAGILDDKYLDALRPLLSVQVAHRTPELAEQPIRLTPLYEVLSESETLRIVRGPYGIGGGPVNAQPGATCGVCGYAAFNGARCVICGNMDD
jgi:hypothetical protein